MIRKMLLWLVLIAVIGIASVLGTLALVRRASAGRLYSSAAEIPHRRVGLLLGCKKQLGDGTPNPFFDHRLRAATALFKAGKIDDSIVRARDVFGIKQTTIISQEFHNQRAIFLASHNDLDAIGFNAADADLGD